MSQADSLVRFSLFLQYSALASNESCLCFINIFGLAMSARVSSLIFTLDPLMHSRNTISLPIFLPLLKAAKPQEDDSPLLIQAMELLSNDDGVPVLLILLSGPGAAFFLLPL